MYKGCKRTGDKVDVPQGSPTNLVESGDEQKRVQQVERRMQRTEIYKTADAVAF